MTSGVCDGRSQVCEEVILVAQRRDDTHVNGYVEVFGLNALDEHGDAATFETVDTR